MSSAKISIRFFNVREAQAVWVQENNKWWFSALDTVAKPTDQATMPKPAITGNV